jgi:hypothetical protein
MFELESDPAGKHTESSRRNSEADFDQPYRFGLRPRSTHPFPFTTREYARLLIFRGRIRDGRDARHDEAA